MKKWATIAGVAVLVLIVARMARADSDRWEYLPGYVPRSGAWT